MYSPIRAFLFALNLLAFACLVNLGISVSITPALAAPISASMGPYPSAVPRNTSTNMLVKHVNPASQMEKREDPYALQVHHDARTILPRSSSRVYQAKIQSLSHYYSNMNGHVNNFR